MNIYTRSQIQSWDQFTILNEPISSIDLMERAADALFDWFVVKYPLPGPKFLVVCGNGNNGGDGLALSRKLLSAGYEVSVYLPEGGTRGADCQANLERLCAIGCEPKSYAALYDLPMEAERQFVVIDGLFGTGLTRPLEGSVADLVRFINSLSLEVVSIDLPSGLPADGLAANDAVICANYTLTFQAPKFSFFLPEHESFVGEWLVLDIGLHKGFEQMERTPYSYLDKGLIQFFKPSQRSRFSHKGHFGHSVILGGSTGMMGAVVMAAKSCLRSGVGLCSLGVQDEGVPIVQMGAPEAMCVHQSQWMQHQFYSAKTSVGAGMGWLANDYHGKLLQWLISNFTGPLLIDATGLNLLAQNMEWLGLRPQGAITVLTPHIGEFSRLTGKSANSVERLEKAKRLASQYQVFIVLKGAFTQVVTPGGLVYFNSTGNPGMARGGSGDVLAGLITGFLAQGMPASVACLLGVYLHGLAGDIAAHKFTKQGMTAMDMVNMLPAAWKRIL